jgi:glyoxylase-like metal-dependent hydrolase (beta-lactamase superfamily II)
MPELARDHRIRFEREDGVTTLSIAPAFAIAQRAFLVPCNASHVLWECLSLVTDEAVREIAARGGVSCIAISHPHFYAAMVDWSDALGGVPLYVHEADLAWIQRPSPHVRAWSGERLELASELELVRLQGHFAGSCGLWWKSGPRPGGSLFPGDALQVAMDRRHCTFMYSYPNAIPLGPAQVRSLRHAVAPLRYDDVFGYSRGRQIIGGGKAAIEASFDRYLDAIVDR